MDPSRRERLNSFRLRGQRRLRIERDDGQIVVGQIFRSDAANIVGCNFLDRREIIAREVEVPGEEPVRAKIGRLPPHGGERPEMMTQ